MAQISLDSLECLTFSALVQQSLRVGTVLTVDRVHLEFFSLGEGISYIAGGRDGKGGREGWDGVGWEGRREGWDGMGWEGRREGGRQDGGEEDGNKERDKGKREVATHKLHKALSYSLRVVLKLLQTFLENTICIYCKTVFCKINHMSIRVLEFRSHPVGKSILLCSNPASLNYMPFLK